jgi:nitrite reductase/ring-hydroxylating ferredoxin subunit
VRIKKCAPCHPFTAGLSHRQDKTPHIAGHIGCTAGRIMKNTRREFCFLTSAAAIASLLEACGGSPTAPDGSNVPQLATVNGTVSSGTVLVNVDSSSPLATASGAVLVRSTSGSFLVARTGQDTFNAVTAVCTHEGCDVTGFQNSTYTCPCHGSQFSTSGAVVKGPASRALQSFQTSFANGQLTIRL